MSMHFYKGEIDQLLFEIIWELMYDCCTKLHLRLEGEELSYNGFAYKDLQKTNRGALANRGAAKASAIKKSENIVDEGADEVPVNNTSTKQQSPTEDVVEKKRYTSADAAADKCTLHKATAFMVDISPYLPVVDDNKERTKGDETLVMCVELVGSRFLRRMVRILVVRMSVDCFVVVNYL